MELIVFAVLFALIFYFWDFIKNLLFYSFGQKQTSQKNSNTTLLDNYGYRWFWIIVLINVILLCFSTWFYYNKKYEPGQIGKTGLPGYAGDNAPDC